MARTSSRKVHKKEAAASKGPFIPCADDRIDGGSGRMSDDEFPADPRSEPLDENAIDWNLEVIKGIEAAEKQNGQAVTAEHVFGHLHATISAVLAHRIAACSIGSTTTNSIRGQFGSVHRSERAAASPGPSRSCSPTARPSEPGETVHTDVPASGAPDGACEVTPPTAGANAPLADATAAVDAAPAVEAEPVKDAPTTQGVDAVRMPQAVASELQRPLAQQNAAPVLPPLQQNEAAGEKDGTEGAGAASAAEEAKAKGGKGAVKEQETNQATDAAAVLLTLGTDKYGPEQEQAGAAAGAEQGQAVKKEDEEEETGTTIVEGIRVSKRKRVANQRVLSDLEPSLEEQNWGKGRGRRVNKLQPGVKGAKGANKKLRVDPVMTHLSPALYPAPMTAMPIFGPAVTLQALRELRDNSHKIDGLEFAILHGDPQLPQSWHSARVIKCDLDFKKVVVRYNSTGMQEQLNFHQEMENLVTFVPRPDFPEYYLGGMNPNSMMQYEMLQQVRMQMAHQAMNGGFHPAQMAAFGGAMGPAPAAFGPGMLPPAYGEWGPRSNPGAQWSNPSAKTMSLNTSRAPNRAGNAPARPKVSNSTAAIARALGLSSGDILPERNPQVKLRPPMFDALRTCLSSGRDKIMCKVTAERGMRTAVLTGATSQGIRVKYLDANQPSSGLITMQDLAEERVVLEVTQVVPVSE